TGRCTRRQAERWGATASTATRVRAFSRTRRSTATTTGWTSCSSPAEFDWITLAIWPIIMRHMAKRTRGIERFRQYLDRGTPGPNSYVVLLGLESLDTAGVLRVAERGIPYGAFDTLRENTALAVEDTMAFVNIPRRTLTRRKREGMFAPDESDRLLRAGRVFGRAPELVHRDAHRAPE